MGAFGPTLPMDETEWRILNLVAKRGSIGTSREDFFREIRGVDFEELERGILALEKDGYVNVEWLSTSRFVITITDAGSTEVTAEYGRRLKAYNERIAAQKSRAGPERT